MVRKLLEVSVKQITPRDQTCFEKRSGHHGVLPRSYCKHVTSPSRQFLHSLYERVRGKHS